MILLPLSGHDLASGELVWPLSWFAGAASIVPLFLPGVLLFAVLGLFLAAPVSRALRTSRPVAWLLVASAGGIAALTLTPTGSALEQLSGHGGTCDLSRIGIAPLSLLTRVDDASMNVLLFIPLGLAIALLPRTRRSGLVLGLAIAYPFVIELTQLLIPPLGRGCESADVVDNLTGLVVGLAIGLAGVGFLRRIRQDRLHHQPPG